MRRGRCRSSVCPEGRARLEAPASTRPFPTSPGAAWSIARHGFFGHRLGWLASVAQKGRMRSSPQRKPRPPLDAAKLNELALAYVGRFATTRAKLRSYLLRKVRERGWDDGPAADVEALAQRFAEQGYVDDAAYALAKSRSLTGRGYGLMRVEQSLRGAGVEEADGDPARQFAKEDCVAAALRFAERRRLGPFANEPLDRPGRERAIAKMVRAGHAFDLARTIVALPPGAPVDRLSLGDEQAYTD